MNSHPDHLNINNLYPIFNNEDIAFQFSVQNNLIFQSLVCEECNNETNIQRDSYRKFGFFFKCPQCHKQYSILYHSVFYYSKLPISKVLFTLYCWAHQYSVKRTCHEVKISHSTCTFYFKQFRSACLDYLINSPIRTIGGEGKTVEIDETLMCKRKYNRGRILCDIWIFGGICRETGEIFAVLVPNRTKEILWNEILNHIEVGTTIITDKWKSYKVIEEQGHKIYTHLSVNHSENFVDPLTGAHTQHVERLWKEVKRINNRYEGIPRMQVESHLAEFIWRNNEVRDQDPFVKAVQLLANTIFMLESNFDE